MAKSTEAKRKPRPHKAETTARRIATAIARATQVHGGRYDYSLTTFHQQRDFAVIVCRKHGPFKQRFASHLQGFGCPTCGKAAADIKLKHSAKELRQRFVAGARIVHGRLYGYKSVDYTDKFAKDKVTIVCRKHGPFDKTYGNHVTRKQGCPACAVYKEASWPIRGTRKQRALAALKIAKETHGGYYTYPAFVSEFENTQSKVTVVCPEHGAYKSTVNNHILRASGCPKCSKSAAELELHRWISKLLPEVEIVSGDRSVLADHELDIYIPSRKLAIEYCGIYWHSQDKLGRNYHAAKQQSAADIGVRLVTVFDAEWRNRNKKPVIQGRIRSALGLTKRHFFARKMHIVRVSPSTAKKFLTLNHVQGDVPSTVRLGLCSSDGILRSLMTFGKPRFSKDAEWELLRFCSQRDCSVAGGQSRLFAAFQRRYAPESVLSYADLRWGIGGTYETLGFKLMRRTAPAPWYIHRSTIGGPNSKLHHRMAVQKHRLPSLLKTFDPNLTAERNLANNSWTCVYDCGTNVYLWEREPTA